MRFVNVNVAALDAAKHAGLALEADARLALDALREALAGHRADAAWERARGRRGRARGTRRSQRLVLRRRTARCRARPR